MHTLHQLPDGSVVVVQWEGKTPVSAQAGFNGHDFATAVMEEVASGSMHLDQWEHLTLTPEAAAYVAATYPRIREE